MIDILKKPRLAKTTPSFINKVHGEISKCENLFDGFTYH